MTDSNTSRKIKATPTANDGGLEGVKDADGGNATTSGEDASDKPDQASKDETPASSSRSASLPAEIISTILSSPTLRPRDLVAASRVSRAFHPLATAILYRSVQLNIVRAEVHGAPTKHHFIVRHFEPLLRTLTTSPGCAAAVQKLWIVFEGGDDDALLKYWRRRVGYDTFYDTPGAWEARYGARVPDVLALLASTLTHLVSLDIEAYENTDFFALYFSHVPDIRFPTVTRLRVPLFTPDLAPFFPAMRELATGMPRPDVALNWTAQPAPPMLSSFEIRPWGIPRSSPTWHLGRSHDTLTTLSFPYCPFERQAPHPFHVDLSAFSSLTNLTLRLFHDYHVAPDAAELPPPFPPSLTSLTLDQKSLRVKPMELSLPFFQHLPPSLVHLDLDPTLTAPPTLLALISDSDRLPSLRKLTLSTAVPQDWSVSADRTYDEYPHRVWNGKKRAKVGRACKKRGIVVRSNGYIVSIPDFADDGSEAEVDEEEETDTEEEEDDEGNPDGGSDLGDRGVPPRWPPAQGFYSWPPAQAFYPWPPMPFLGTLPPS
ncbi:hypothetical protein JCM6882_002161 [Rhodosporidiobolus microsporus]